LDCVKIFRKKRYFCACFSRMVKNICHERVGEKLLRQERLK
jgi:hypothetical protein